MRLGILAFLIAVIGVVISQSAYIVSETRQVLVLRFGEVVSISTEPGLKFLVPFIEETREIEKRIIPFQLPNKAVILADQRNIEVDAFARYRITNPQSYYTRTGGGDMLRAESQLRDYFTSALTTVLGRSTLGGIVRDDRGDLMLAIAADFRSRAQEIGIDVLDVRLQSVDLPDKNRDAVYAQMKAERDQEAADIRAKGEEKAKSISAVATETEGKIRGDATREEQKILGEADAQRTAILANAYNKDKDFTRLWLALQSYQQIYETGGPPLVLNPEEGFFRYLGRPNLSEAQKAEAPRAKEPAQPRLFTPTP